MLPIIFYALPSILMIFALYLFFFQASLLKLFKLAIPKLIHLIAITTLLLALLGFTLIYYQLRTASLIWLIVILIYIGLIAFLVYTLLNQEPPSDHE